MKDRGQQPRPRRVVVVAKTTNFENYGVRIRELVTRGFLPESELAALQRSHDEHYDTLRRLKEALAEFGVPFGEAPRAAAWRSEEPYDAVFTVGGDGTMCAASHQMMQGGVLVGIRSSQESVGYLCAGDQATARSLVEKLVAGNLKVLRVRRLIADVIPIQSSQPTPSAPVLNDILFANRNPAGTTRYDLELGAKVERHKSSGVWCSTPLGSTAAIQAAGGQVVTHSDRRFQFLVREPYANGADARSRYQLLHGFFTGEDPDRDCLTITNRTEGAILALDGQHGIVSLAYGDRIMLRRGQDLDIADRDA